MRPDPIILNMRLSQVRDLIARLSNIHATLDGATHRGWAHCECEMAKILREASDKIAEHLKLLPMDKTESRAAKLNLFLSCTPNAL